VTETNDADVSYPACSPAQGAVMTTPGSSAGGGWVATRRGHENILIHVVEKAVPNIRPTAVRHGEPKDEPEQATVRRQREGTLSGLVSRVLWD